MTCIWMFIDAASMKHCLYELQHLCRSWLWKYISWTTLVKFYGLMDLVKGQ
jgi:hypothetical protein